MVPAPATTAPAPTSPSTTASATTAPATTALAPTAPTTTKSPSHPSPIVPPHPSHHPPPIKPLSAGAERRQARRRAPQALRPPNAGATVFAQIYAGVEAMVSARAIAPHKSIFTTIDSLLEAYKAEAPEAIDPRAADPSLSMFRSSLGRVLKPFEKRGGFLGLAGRGLEVVDVRRYYKEGLLKHGALLRGQAENSEEVRELRVRREELRAERERKGVVPGLGEGKLEGTFRYVDEFLRCVSAPDMLRAKLFPDGKELAESMSAYNAVRDYLLLRQETSFDQFRPERPGKLRADDRSVTAVVVGDGSTPRTAGLFAFRTQWTCVSIDPELKTAASRPWAGIERLDERRQRVQDATVNISGDVVLVLWHAHVSVADACACLVFDGERWDVEDEVLSRRNRKRVAIVSCACCNWEPEQRVMPGGSKPDAEYDDVDVPGGKRTLRIWQFGEKD